MREGSYLGSKLVTKQGFSELGACLPWCSASVNGAAMTWGGGDGGAQPETSLL